MKQRIVSVFIIAGLMSVLLSGCRISTEVGDGALETGSKPVAGAEGGTAPEGTKAEPEGTKTEPEGTKTEPRPESGSVNQSSTLPYQFVKEYGIIQSEYPVYELVAAAESRLSQYEITAALTFAVRQKQELIISIVLDDDSAVERIPAGGELPDDVAYQTLSDGTRITSERYQNELWKSGQGLFLTGPGLEENGIKPRESIYAVDPAYFETYGRRRYIIEAKFELSSAAGHENDVSGYGLRVLDFEHPLEFALKRAPEYETLEELAAEEHGSLDTHDGISIVSMGERVKEGILVSWYVFCETGQRRISITYKPPLQETALPTISGKEREYPIKQLPANPYWDCWGLYRLSDVRQDGRRTRCMFDVPQEEQDDPLRINIPGITFLNPEESPEITLPIPEDYEELNEDIPWEDGTVRILGITRMKELQTAEISDQKGGTRVRESPGVYIDVAAVHDHKELALRGLICQRKLRWTGWEHERYDFDGNGNLSGFRVFYDEGDQSVTLKFHGAAFYWNQPYVMELVRTPLGV